MRKLISFTTFFVLFLIVILPLFLSFFIKFIPVGIQPPLTTTKRIYEAIILSQQFVALEDNLAGIGVSLKNPRFANKKNVYINILDNQNNIIRKITLNGQNIADGNFDKIFFEPIKDSRNKQFTWSIFSPDSNKDDAIEVFLTNREPFWSLEFKENSNLNSSGESLSYLTLYMPKTIEITKRIGSELINNLTKDVTFSIDYSLLILILITYLFI